MTAPTVTGELTVDLRGVSRRDVRAANDVRAAFDMIQYAPDGVTVRVVIPPYWIPLADAFGAFDMLPAVRLVVCGCADTAVTVQAIRDLTEAVATCEAVMVRRDRPWTGRWQDATGGGGDAA